MKLTTMTQVSIDGVMEDNGRWARGKGDATTTDLIKQTYERADAFLFGRRTYEFFAGSWGTTSEQDIPDWAPVVRALNSRPKYVVSTTLTEPAWSGTILLPDATAIADLKAEQSGELQVHGSGALIRWLLEHDLVDEMTLIVVPVIVGRGARLFPHEGPGIALDLIESRVDSNGVATQVYRPQHAQS
ncbi:deaminase/reductase [Lentzea aerocolonigenes]|uniref:Deaminase/reductase n=1 Tax=Lentzea aerocolonigenes TaxID=68170 RepID=A0A0F0GKE8_LENAE|nr:dihydrofolate reductase family protein [Lentzea aerocolonigenes]KJK43770.1 deaminase/reductase [Lentzea aerocolonigenes]